MHITVITLFPELFPSVLGAGVLGDALARGIWSLTTVNPRDFATDRHKTVDDTPYGGGAGMVLKAEVLAAAIESIPLAQRGRILYLSPRGQPLTQKRAVDFAAYESALTLICGRYEGIDQRVLDAYDIEELSIGDYILTGGEVAAMVLCEAVLRLIQGVVGNHQTLSEESFDHNLLEYPHYTRPAIWVDKTGKERHVPSVLQSGHHALIATWRRQQSELLTRERRPDLWQRYQADGK